MTYVANIMVYDINIGYKLNILTNSLLPPVYSLMCTKKEFIVKGGPGIGVGPFLLFSTQVETLAI